MDPHTISRRALMSLAGTALWPARSHAQDARPATARLLVGFPAGGAADAVARRLADIARGPVAEAVIVDNRAGAGGRIAIEALRNGPADGSQWLLTPGSMVTIYPHVYRKLSYDPSKDLQPVGVVAHVPLALIAGPSVPASVTDVRGYLNWVRANPASANVGSPALGNVTHFLAFQLERAADLKLPVVAYRGSAPAVQDLLGGHVPVIVNPITDALAHLASGRLRILGVTARSRTALAPGAATFVEQGFGQVVGSEWLAVFAHVQTPRVAIERMASALRAGVRTPLVTEAFAKLAIEPVDPDPASLSRQIGAELAHWRDVAKALDFHIDD